MQREVGNVTAGLSFMTAPAARSRCPWDEVAQFMA
jgi:hypothetical protein